MNWFGFLPHGIRSRLRAKGGAAGPFGYKTGWLAVATDDGTALRRHLRLTRIREVGWSSGLHAVHAARSVNGPVFAMPPMNGWTLVLVGFRFDSDSPAFHALLADLSTRFGEAQFFCSHRGQDARTWQRARSGLLERAFSIADTTVTLNIGRTTAEERSLGLPDISGLSPDHMMDKMPDDPDNRWIFGDEDDVMAVAGLWSINPQRIGTDIQPAGLRGHLAQMPLLAA